MKQITRAICESREEIIWIRKNKKIGSHPQADVFKNEIKRKGERFTIHKLGSIHLQPMEYNDASTAIDLFEGGGGRSNGKSASRSVEMEKNREKYFRKKGVQESSYKKVVGDIMLTISSAYTAHVFGFRVSVSRQKKGTWKIVNRMCFTRVKKYISLCLIIYLYIYIYHACVYVW